MVGNQLNGFLRCVCRIRQRQFRLDGREPEQTRLQHDEGESARWEGSTYTNARWDPCRPAHLLSDGLRWRRGRSSRSCPQTRRQLFKVWLDVIEEVRFQPTRGHSSSQRVSPIPYRQDRLTRVRVVERPAGDVFFRPEEIHPVSEETCLVIPVATRERIVHLAHSL